MPQGLPKKIEVGLLLPDLPFKLGDPTARDAGRLSLNPLRHIDPVGTIIVPCLMIFAHLPFVFGWAKPENAITSRLPVSW